MAAGVNKDRFVCRSLLRNPGFFVYEAPFLITNGKEGICISAEKCVTGKASIRKISQRQHAHLSLMSYFVGCLQTCRGKAHKQFLDLANRSGRRGERHDIARSDNSGCSAYDALCAVWTSGCTQNLRSSSIFCTGCTTQGTPFSAGCFPGIACLVGLCSSGDLLCWRIASSVWGKAQC